MSAHLVDEEEDSSDGEPAIGLEALRPEALAALTAFTQERETAEAAGDFHGTENFGLSQFWYSDAFSDAVAAALRAACPSGRIAVVSCPSVHRALLRLDPEDSAVLFEYDAKLGDRLRPDQFVRYDYNEAPEEYAAMYPSTARLHSYDFVVLDPPYVAHSCVERFWAFAAHLSAAAHDDGALFFTSVVNRAWLGSFSTLRLTDKDLEFSTKLRTPLRAFTNSHTLATALDGFAPDDDDDA